MPTLKKGTGDGDPNSASIFVCFDGAGMKHGVSSGTTDIRGDVLVVILA